MSYEMTVTFGESLRIQADYRGHTIHTDQDPAAGGDGSAPSPVDLFLASLATCTGFYVRDFCRSREIPTGGVRVRMTWEKAEALPVGAVTLHLHVPPGFPERYLRPLERAAAQCTVKRLLADPPTVTTRLHHGD